MIMTVNGAIPNETLGFCQSHEHLFIKKGYPSTIFSHQCIDDIEKSTAELIEYRKRGGSAIVDAQPLGCCRNPDSLHSISQKSGVHIIASTGFHKLVFYPEDHWIRTIDVDELTEIYIWELTKGMYIDGDIQKPTKHSHICAGQIKSALDSGEFSAVYEKLFIAAINAAKATGAVLMVHIENNPIFLVEFLEKMNLDLKKVIFCHMDRTILDLNIHKEICKKGIYLEYDTIARFKYHSDEKEIKIILEMLAAGFEKQILFSLDTTRDRLKNYGGIPGLTYILDFFINKLRSNGISERHIENFFINNPRDVFSRI